LQEGASLSLSLSAQAAAPWLAKSSTGPVKLFAGMSVSVIYVCSHVRNKSNSKNKNKNNTY